MLNVKDLVACPHTFKTVQAFHAKLNELCGDRPSERKVILKDFDAFLKQGAWIDESGWTFAIQSSLSCAPMSPAKITAIATALAKTLGKGDVTISLEDRGQDSQGQVYYRANVTVSDARMIGD